MTKTDPSTVALASKKGQERAGRIQARIDYLDGQDHYTVDMLRSALSWALERLEFVERQLSSFEMSEVRDDGGCDACRDLPTEPPKGHRYLRSGHPGLVGITYVHSSKCVCGASDNEVVGLRQNCAACRRRREVDQARSVGEVEPRGLISQAQAVAIIEAWDVEGLRLNGRVLLDGLDLEQLGIR